MKSHMMATAVAIFCLSSGPTLASVAVIPAGPEAILGTIPAYPLSSRPLRHWESPRLAIALTPDKPEAVIGYYIDQGPRLGWRPEDGIAAEALRAAHEGQPAWLTFRRTGHGRVDLQITRGTHPKTGQPITLIFYQSQFKH